MNSNKLERKISELSALYEVTKTLGSSLDIKDTAQKAFDILHRMLGLNRGTLVVKDFESGEYSIWAAHGLTKKEIERGRYRVGEGVTGKVLETGQPMIVPDIGKEPLFLNRTKSRDLKRMGVSFLCVPVQVKGETLGVLSVDRIFGDHEGGLDEDIRFLTVLASLVGQAVILARTVAEKRRELVDENIHLHEELKVKYRLANVVGGSRKMQEVYEIVERVAPTRSTVLIRGESGTGKELIARALHYNSPRAEKAFIRVSCAALPETLLESELFGHEKGAFTSANEARKGRFELADAGTLFLDEIGEMSLATQVKLLRVLQERKFERLGGTVTHSVDVRLVTATNRDLEAGIKEGIFREDLYYRLNVIPIYLPPLREREADTLLLIEHFLQIANRDHGKSVAFSKPALEQMTRYAWPGNVRELENCVERLVVLSQNGVVDPEHLPLSIKSGLATAPQAPPLSLGSSESGALPEAVKGMEREKILRTLQDCGGVQIKAARALGLTQRQLGYKIKKYGIRLRVPLG
jgi:Nif-specific regulatory protein